MLTKQAQLESTGTSPALWSNSQAEPLNATTSSSSSNSPTAFLGANLTIQGEITSEEDLQIDGKVRGPISLQGRR